MQEPRRIFDCIARRPDYPNAGWTKSVMPRVPPAPLSFNKGQFSCQKPRIFWCHELKGGYNNRANRRSQPAVSIKNSHQEAGTEEFPLFVNSPFQVVFAGPKKNGKQCPGTHRSAIISTNSRAQDHFSGSPYDSYTGHAKRPQRPNSCSQRPHHGPHKSFSYATNKKAFTPAPTWPTLPPPFTRWFTI